MLLNLRNLRCIHKHQPWIIYLFQRKVQWCCWGTTPKGAKWILEQYCILDYSPQVRRSWKPSLWGCFFGGGRLQIVRGIDNQNQTLVVNSSQQSEEKNRKKSLWNYIFFSFAQQNQFLMMSIIKYELQLCCLLKQDPACYVHILWWSGLKQGFIYWCDH